MCRLHLRSPHLAIQRTIIQPNTSCNGKTDQMLVVVYYFYGFNGTNILYHKTDLFGDYSLMAWHGLCPIYSHFVANTRFLGLFCADFYADIWDLTQTLRRYLEKKPAAESSGVDPKKDIDDR